MRCVACLAIAALSVQTALAPPNLSGHWVWDAAKTRKLVGGPPQTPAGPLEWTIAQTPDSITMGRPWPVGGPQKFTYKLDGSATANVIGAVTYRTTARWEAGRLVIEGTMSSAGLEGPVVVGMVKEVRWLTADGDLAIVSDRTVYSLNKPIPTLTQVFIKQ